MPVISNAEMGQFNCEFCKFTDSSKSKVSSHMLTRHHCSISYSCTLCDFCCGLKEIFYLHLLSHQHCHEIVHDTYKSEEDVCNDFQKRELLKLFQGDIRTANHPPEKVEENPMIGATKSSKGRLKRSFSSSNKQTKASSCNQSKMLSLGRKAKPLKTTPLFKCPSCGCCLENMRLLRLHRRKIHPTTRFFPCPKKFDCSYVANSKRALSNHVQYNHKKIQDSMYECVECNKKFTSLSSLKPHLRTHLTNIISKDMVITPRTTSLNLRKASPLVANKTSSHNKPETGKDHLLVEMKETLICPLKTTENDYCSQNQERMTELERLKVRDGKSSRRGHVSKDKIGIEADQHNFKSDIEKIQKSLDKREHHEKEKLKQGKEMPYTQSEMLFLEVAKRIDRKATEFQCPHCPYIGKVFRNFKEHVMGHSEHRPYVCSSCCSSFVCKSKLVRHQRQVHNEARPFLCSECPYTGKSRSCLETHRLVMHPREEHLRFSCSHCPARFARASMLKTHTLQHDTGPHKLFSCPSCSFSTNYRRQFELHSTLHTGKSCLCSLCGKAYSGHAQLRIHMKVQHSDQRFHCTLCDFVTKRPEGLTKHMKSHSTERPYSCPHCDYKGKRKAHLHRHVLRHLKTDQAPEKNEKSEAAADRFPCLGCNKVFKSRDKLLHHLKTHDVHGSDISESMQCNLNSTISNGNSSNCITSNSFSGLNYTNFSHHKEANIFPSSANSFSCQSNITNVTTSNNWVSRPVEHFTPGTLPNVAVTNIHPHHRQTHTMTSVTSQYLGDETLSVATPTTSMVHPLQAQPILLGHSHIHVVAPSPSHTSANAPSLVSKYKHMVSSSITPQNNQHLGMVASAIKLQQSNRYPVITASVPNPLLCSQNLDVIAPTMTSSLSTHSHGLMAPVILPTSNEHQVLAAHSNTPDLGSHHYCAVTSVATPCLNNQQPGVITSQAAFHLGTHQHHRVTAAENRSSTLYQHPDLATSIVTLSMNFQQHMAPSEARIQHQSGIARVAPPPSSSHYPGLTTTISLGLQIPSSAVPVNQMQHDHVMSDAQRNQQTECST